MKKSFLLVFIAFLSLNSCHVGRFFAWNFADANDHKKFRNVEIQKGQGTFSFYESPSPSNLKLPDSLSNYKDKTYPFQKALEKSGTVAFMVIRNDSILYENYLGKFEEDSQHPSFSMAKSYVSALVGIAIDEGHIASVQDLAIDYVPQLDKELFSTLTIEHLLDMQSGILFNEGYANPFGHVAKSYYGTNLKKMLTKLKPKREPGKYWDYISINTQILSEVVENATGTPIHQYLEQKIWQPLGMEYDASWSIDSKKNQTVKAFCCLNARARDFAKFGRLYLNKGKWNGKQIISEKWVDQSVTFDRVKNNFSYSYQWWHTRKYIKLTDTTEIPALHQQITYTDKNGEKKEALSLPYPDFFAQGILGQFVYVHPEKNMIMVRLGKRYGKVSWSRLFKKIAEMN